MGLNCQRWRLPKALGARVTVVTVITPFHVITVSPGMLSDTPERYKEHVTALASQYLDVAKILRRRPEWRAIWCILSASNPYKAIIDTAQNRGCDAIHLALGGVGPVAA
jgi:nucleotide-binding universal stress UspA family protein